LRQNKKLTIYLGIDPTGPTLHLGHVIPLLKLRELQDLGHKVILLMGDFTAMIGDPTDKSATRKQLTHKEVLKNLKDYKKQASKIISFTGKNKAEFKFNSKWLAKMNLENVLSLASKMTVQQMMERDMFEKRFTEGKPVYIHEFLYPLMQGYDSVAMNVDGEVGGNDQTFNMLTGRTLMKEMKNSEKFVITMKLLVDSSGTKMGKTEGNMLTLSDTPRDMYGKVMSWDDTMIIRGFELLTRVPQTKIKELKDKIVDNVLNPKDAKMQLAKEIVRFYFGEKDASNAENAFVSTFQKKIIPEIVQELYIEKNQNIADVLVEKGLVKSKSDLRRLIEGRAIENLDNKTKLKDINEFNISGNYRIGPKKFIKVNFLK
jgi:tyrosyl-tRNA synthetase